MEHRLNIHEAKTHLSRYLNELKEGDRLILCRRNIPIAEVKPLQKPEVGPRPIGLGKGSVRIPASFHEPLPDDVLSLFEGSN
jgi:antitoxin (DNA-binding transcriptional repressor) of toxin-antitoxin stability system